MSAIEKVNVGEGKTRHVELVVLIDKTGNTRAYASANETEPSLLYAGQLSACLTLNLEYKQGQGLDELYKTRFGVQAD